uniref:Lipoprotein n=1 Tax=Parastrongyloides trichosuri TaxID=131310 RepID=A0A0N5A752_PARTI
MINLIRGIYIKSKSCYVKEFVMKHFILVATLFPILFLVTRCCVSRSKEEIIFPSTSTLTPSTSNGYYTLNVKADCEKSNNAANNYLLISIYNGDKPILSETFSFNNKKTLEKSIKFGKQSESGSYKYSYECHCNGKKNEDQDKSLPENVDQNYNVLKFKVDCNNPNKKAHISHNN